MVGITHFTDVGTEAQSDKMTSGGMFKWETYIFELWKQWKSPQNESPQMEFIFAACVPHM